MTNSAPKLNDKVERQGSPNNGLERHHYHHRSGPIKSSTFFHNGGRHVSRNNSGRLSCSPHCGQSKSTRNSPLRYEYSPRGSPTNSFYAGAKFSEPPSAASLPKPPSHWTTRLMTSCQQQSERTCDISKHLKMVLNVQA